MNTEPTAGSGPELPPVLKDIVGSLTRPAVPTELPITLDSKRARVFGCIALVFMWPFFFGAVALGIAALADSGSDRVGAAFMSVVCSVVCLSALGRVIGRRVITIDRERVTLRRSLWGLSLGSWSEPLDRYEGLVYWVRHVSSGGSKKGSSRRTRHIHTMTLRHAKRRRSIDLMASEHPRENMHEVCEAYARLLGVPVLEQVAGKAFKRQVEDLDKSVWQLVREGKVETGGGLPAAPPRRVDLQQRGDTEVVTVGPGKAMKAGLMVAYLILLLGFSGLGVLAVSGRLEAVEMFAAFSIFALVFAGIILGVSFRALQRVSIELGPETIRIGTVSKAGERGVVQTVPAATVEGIQFTSKGALQLSLTGGHRVSSRTLGREEAEWICDHILRKYSSQLPTAAGERPAAAAPDASAPSGEIAAGAGEEPEADRAEAETAYRLAQLHHGWVSSVALVITNVIPLFGVWLLDWDVLAILLFYWLESLVAGGFGLLRVLSSLYPGLAALRTKVQYAIHFFFFYGLFALFQGFCVLAIYYGVRGELPGGAHPVDFLVGLLKATGFPVAAPRGVELPELSASLRGLAGSTGIPLLALLFGYGLTWVSGLLGRDESRLSPPRHLFESAYYKIATMIIASILGAFIAAMGSGGAVLVGVLTIKMGMDLGGHLGDLRRLPRRRGAGQATREQAGSSFIVTCPECRRTHDLPPFVAGGVYTCPSCQSVNRPPSSYVAISPKGRPLFLNGFIITLPLIFVVLCMVQIFSLFEQAGPIPWQETEATVKSFRVGENQRRGIRSGPRTVYVVWVNFRYTIDGEGRGRTKNKRMGSYDSREEAERAAKALGETIPLYYDAKRPYVISLGQPGEASRPLEISGLLCVSVGLLLSLAFTGLGIYVASPGARLRVKTRWTVHRSSP